MDVVEYTEKVAYILGECKDGYEDVESTIIALKEVAEEYDGDSSDVTTFLPLRSELEAVYDSNYNSSYGDSSY